jgi:lipopolysaccharide biosynthesis regulator YciM
MEVKFKESIKHRDMMRQSSEDIKGDNELFELYLWLGRAYVLVERYSDAKNAFDSALRYKPKDLNSAVVRHPYYASGAYFRLDEYSEVIRRLKDINPEDSATYNMIPFYLGVSYHHLNEPNKSSEMLRQFIEENGSWVESSEFQNAHQKACNEAAKGEICRQLKATNDSLKEARRLIGASK